MFFNCADTYTVCVVTRERCRPNPAPRKINIFTHKKLRRLVVRAKLLECEHLHLLQALSIILRRSLPPPAMWKLILILAFQVVVRGNSIATDNETAKTNESGLVKNQMLGMPVTLGDNKGEQKTAKGSAPRDCTEYCSLSYPPHTYPQVSLHCLEYERLTSFIFLANRYATVVAVLVLVLGLL